VAATIYYSNNCVAVMSDSQTCVICHQGCDTVDKSSDGVCPKFWQRPAGSLVCSQAWFCIPYASINQRIIGSFFFLIALIYIRIIYYNYKKTSTASPDVALRAPGSRSPILILFGGSSPAILQLCKLSYNYATYLTILQLLKKDFSIARYHFCGKFHLGPLQGDHLAFLSKAVFSFSNPPCYSESS
jgi:hypothetical protein